MASSEEMRAVVRLMDVEDADAVARESGISLARLRTLEKRLRPHFEKANRPSTTELIEEIARMAVSFGYSTERRFCFSFPEVGLMKRYCPDGVWAATSK